MFEATSRYAGLETPTTTLPDGRTVRYVRRRFLPVTPNDAVFVEHVVTEGERLDHIAARFLGDPQLFWQLCDVNNAMRPDDLEELGRRLRVTLLPT